ncbi:MAG: MBL fold metallo-hydrolase [Acidobacteriota bacterium]
MKLGDLAQRGIIVHEDGYYIIRQPMPYPLAESNSYLIECRSGWSIIDVGVDLPGTREIWEKALPEIGISFKQIDRILITHCHPDHLGAARWLQELSEAPVLMSRDELNRANKYIFLSGDFEAEYRRAIEGQCQKHGFSLQFTADLIKDWHQEVTPLFKPPSVIQPFDEGDKFELLGQDFSAIQIPGHADGQIILWNPVRRHAFGADVVSKSAYLHFTDWPNTGLANPLKEFLTSLEKIESLGEIKTFPGHGPTFGDIQSLLQALRNRHQRWLDRISASVTSPVTAGELYTQVYQVADYIHHHRVVLGETLGYLVYLADMNRLSVKTDENRMTFAPID